MDLGKRFDKVFERLQETIRQMEAEEKELEAQGCVRAYIHFKPDGRTMFLLSPVDATGRRKYTHVGVSPEKQETARAAVAREHRRAELAAQRRDLAQALDGLQWEATTLLDKAHSVSLDFLED